MHLISLLEADPRRITGHLEAPRAVARGGGGLVAVLDFLPLGPEGLALRAAAARAGLTLVTGAELLPGFPGETDLLSAVRHVGAFADAVLIRHPLTGAARAAASISAAPVLSLGDGTGEDPVSGLAELSALSEKLDGLAGRSVALCGDLRRKDLDHQLDLFADMVTSSKAERRAVRHQVREVHALWVAAPRNEQGEPRGRPSGGSGLPWRDPDGRILISPSEPSAAEEADPAEEAPARVRALAALLAEVVGGGPLVAPLPEEAYVATEGARCEVETCIACREPARISSAFVVTRTDPVLLTCAYCHTRRQARFVGSRVERRYHRLTSGQVRKIKRKNTVFFATEAEARAAGFVPSKV